MRSRRCCLLRHERLEPGFGVGVGVRFSLDVRNSHGTLTIASPELSTRVTSTYGGYWVLLKVRTDLDSVLASRIKSAQSGTGDPGRNIRAIAGRLGSSNTIVVDCGDMK